MNPYFKIMLGVGLFICRYYYYEGGCLRKEPLLLQSWARGGADLFLVQILKLGGVKKWTSTSPKAMPRVGWLRITTRKGDVGEEEPLLPHNLPE